MIRWKSSLKVLTPLTYFHFAYLARAILDLFHVLNVLMRAPQSENHVWRWGLSGVWLWQIHHSLSWSIDVANCNCIFILFSFTSYIILHVPNPAQYGTFSFNRIRFTYFLSSSWIIGQLYLQPLCVANNLSCNSFIWVFDFDSWFFSYMYAFASSCRLGLFKKWQ